MGVYVCAAGEARGTVDYSGYQKAYDTQAPPEESEC